MTILRCFLQVLSCFIVLGYCTNPRYYDNDFYDDCFQGAPGWYHLTATCIFPLTQFERNYSTAIQMCGAVNHSIGYRETNWLIASQLLEIFTNEQNRNLMKMYWTGLVIKSEDTIGVESEDATETMLDTVADFTSIHNPLWAEGQPAEDLPTNELMKSCIALDLRNTSNFGWRVLPCSYQLPILCQNYACIPGTFRCVDNSKCIPSSFRNDGFNDCLDGSDESKTSQNGPISSSTPNSLLSSILRENPVYEWPMIVSSRGVLSPTTVRYGRGECTHRWTVLSPNDRHFDIWIKWITPITSTSIFIEGKDQNGRIFMNSRNATSSFTLLSSSFVLTASDTDTRKIEFQIHFQEVDNSLCRLSENSQLLFNSETIPTPCHYQFSTQSPSSYVALLIRKSEGISPSIGNIKFNNSTLSLIPSRFKKLLVIPSNSLQIYVNTTWPGSETKLDIQFFELRPGAESVDVFLIDMNFEIEWIPKSNDICMEGQFRTLTVNMILTSSGEESVINEALQSTWNVEKLRKSCSEDNVQIVSTNRTTYVEDQNIISGFGPTTVVIHQSAEPFEFHSIYSIQQPVTEDPGRLLDVTNVGLEASTITAIGSTTTIQTNSGVRCKLPIVVDGYVESVSYNPISYSSGTVVYIECIQGYLIDPLPYSLTCDDNGMWIDENSKAYYGDHPTVKCYPINCPSATPFEPSLIPDSYATTYGSVRKYQNVTSDFAFGPFCVCGDDAEYIDQWLCFNSEHLTSTLIPGACILPEAPDALFVTQSGIYQNVFPSGYTIKMHCTICPFVTKYFTCQKGLWMTSEGLVQPYNGFKCNCAADKDFVDPCKPYGTYDDEYKGFYICKCDKGYKFQDGTCKDIDECLEKSDYCDGSTDPPIARCNNFEGGFSCSCASNFHTYNYTTVDINQWGFIMRDLIDGYSCIETTCPVNNNWGAVQVISPPTTSEWYKSGTSVYSYATNICEDTNFPCVFQFKQTCFQTTLQVNPNPLAACPALDTTVFDYDHVGFPSFHTFQMIDVTCKVSAKTMIGRPKVFCNANSEWEILPTCIWQSCSNLTQLVQWPLLIDFINSTGTGFEYMTTVSFKCANGGALSHGSVSCIHYAENYEWSSPLPTCYSTTTAGLSSPSSSSSSPFPTYTTATSSSTTATSLFTFPWDPIPTPTTRATTVSQQIPAFYDDVVIEGSMTFEENNVLDQQELWTQTADWIWTPSGCIVHQWTFPISFLVTSIPIKLNSDQIELLVDISQCNSSVQVGVVSSTDGFIPPISDFRPVMNTTSSGSFVVKLKNLKPYLALSITANGYVQICGVTIRENVCDEVDYNGLHLTSSKPFMMRKYIQATCGNSRRVAPIRGYCDSRRGWVVQNTPCLCNLKPPCSPAAPLPQWDQTGTCDLNSCQDGVCLQFDNHYDCQCNDLFVKDTRSTGEPYCRPNHCVLTSSTRNSGYNCQTGEVDEKKRCPNATFLGDFCQYEGTLSNNSYIYMLKIGAINAIATNVCEDANTEYAMDNVVCAQKPSTTTAAYSGCSLCHNGAGCTSTSAPFDGAANCICPSTFYGRTCEVSKFCFDSYNNYVCLNGGTCDRDNQKCNCTSNFNGTYCEKVVIDDNCFVGEKDCVNGNCRRENDLAYCNCNDGYIKDSAGNCTILWNMCDLNNPCQQNGSCEFNAETGVLQCDCSKSGWEGEYCEKQPHLDTCNACGEHVEKCYSNFTSYVRCQCSIGFSGSHCDQPINDCIFSPCFNSGTCNPFGYMNSNGDLIESYNCTCPTGYAGTNCESQVTPDCNELISCQNGGTCELVSIDSAVCNCTDQFYGTYCEKRCSDECAHAHGCNEDTNGQVCCECLEGFSSPLCDVVDNVCTANILVCQNSGTCNSNTTRCDCSDLYSGTYCENSLNKCETNSIVCENGGTCIKETGACECPPNYTGPLCENQIHSCRDITCFNGGTCIDYNATCSCLPGTTGDRCQDLGQPCIINNPDGSTTPYCVHGRCLNLPNGAACDCNGTEYTGRRCETMANPNFNLVFNGLDYVPDIVSRPFYNISIAQFTICSFVQYNHPTIETNKTPNISVPTLPPWLIMRGYGQSQRIVFDNNGFFICDSPLSDKECNRAELSNFKPTPISANTWHHFCLVSPDDLTSPNYTVYLDGVEVRKQAIVTSQLAPNFNPGLAGYLQLAPSNLTEKRFEGMISMTQLYIIRLNETQIGQLAYDCFSTISDTNSEIANNTLISWNGGFTRVSSSNPGVFIDPAGICRSVKCMFGRQAKANNYNTTGTCEKDRIAPTVLRCPSNKKKQTTEDFIKVKWSDDEISFFDNIGVVRIVVNYHNGQQFGVGITAVRYIAFDEAGNSAECTFDVIVYQNTCPQNIYVDGGIVKLFASTSPFASSFATVKCNDSLYPVENRPRFYVCDIMGNFNYGDQMNATKGNYYLPGCGKTLPAVQEINGTVVGSGSCSQVYQKLREVIWTSANCDQIGSCRILILPPCNETSNGFWNSRASENDMTALQYTFSTSNAVETISSTILTHLQTNFTLVRQDSTVECDKSFPIHDTTGNYTVCISCPEGTFANITSNQCQDCPLNSYRNSTSADQLSCTPCPESTITGDVTGAVYESQCYRKCEVGKYELDGSCVPCPEGTFAETEGLRKCTCCGFDLSTFGTGKTSFNDCIKTCGSGQEMVRDETEVAPYCQDCDIGYYKEGDRGPCIQCPRGLSTHNTASKSINECNKLNCIDANTMQNQNVTAGPNTTYSELCIVCEQGTYQNVPNSDHCLPCSDLPDDASDVPVTCQSTCSAEIPTEGCNCQLQTKGNNSMIIRNCLPEVVPAHTNSGAIKIVLPIVFGVLLIIIVVLLFCFRKQIIAWIRKTDTSDNQHVALSHWNNETPPRTEEYRNSPNYQSGPQSPSSNLVRRNPQLPQTTIPRPYPDLRILTSREEMDRLPPLPSSSTYSFPADSSFKPLPWNRIESSGIGLSSGIRHLGSGISPLPTIMSSTRVTFQENGEPIIRSPVIKRKDTSGDDSSLDSDFF